MELPTKALEHLLAKPVAVACDATVELRLGVSPVPNDAWRGLCRGERDVPEVITMRTICRDDHIALGLENEVGAIAAELAAVVEHVAVVNAAYLRLEQLGAEAAAVAVRDLSSRGADAGS